MRKISNHELGRKNVEEFRAAVKIPLVVVLDNVRSLHNVGSVFRTADAFLCESIFLCGITAVPPQREMEKTALGATESVAWKYFKSTLEAIDDLRKNGYEIIAVEQAEGGQELENYLPDPKKKYALVFGHEMYGVSEEVLQKADGAIAISQHGTKHSLNISVCAGIVVHYFSIELLKNNR
jgi:23S rRNA (guanosine2251-2'-O)-methyltransferase